MAYPNTQSCLNVRDACAFDFCLCEDVMPIENIQDKKKYLAELATVLNSFKSEAVQLRLLEHLLGNLCTCV